MIKEKLLNSSSFFINDKTLGAISSAEINLVRADAMASDSPLIKAIRKQLLRTEALASVSVDGYNVKYRDLLKLETAICLYPHYEGDYRLLYQLVDRLELENKKGVVKAFRYMRAVDWVSQNINKDTHIEPKVIDTILELYNENLIENIAKFDQSPNMLLPRTKDRGLSRSLPTIIRQNPELIDDYFEFINRNILSPSSQAEISHSQLQLIKPYEGNLDGFERLFTHIIFYKRGILSKTVAPLAFGPAKNIKKHAVTIFSNMLHLSGSTDNRFLDCNASFENSAYCTEMAARTIDICRNALCSYKEQWINTLGSVKNDSATGMVLSYLLEMPYLTITSVAKHTGKSFSAINNALKIITDAGVVQELGHMMKHQVFIASDLIHFFESLMMQIIPQTQLTRDELLAELENSSRK